MIMMMMMMMMMMMIPQIYLPSGREVKVSVGAYYQNVVLTVPGSDMDKGDGQHCHFDPGCPSARTVCSCICILY